MKTLQLTMIFVMALISSTLSAQTLKTENLKVWGNCSMCKKHIETSLKVDGVAKADWDKKTKILSVTYDSAKISNDQIQKNIASGGYDTEKYKADDKAYTDLDECCQYDRKTSKNNKKDE
jgi:copper chaperone CopZ